MTSRELVFRTLRHEPTPRAARNMWLLPWAEQRYPQELAAIRRDYPDDFDYPPIQYPPVDGMRGDPYATGTCVDEWGCEFISIQPGAIGEVKNPMIQNYATDMAKLRPPVEWYDINLDPAGRLREKSDKFLLLGSPVRLFERMQFLRGTENLYIDLAEQPAELFKLRDIVHEWNVRMLERLVKADVDAISWMDDWGSQSSLLMSPKMWREFFKPCYRQYCEIIKRAGKFCLVHSDGFIMDVYEDCIEIGIDAINSQLFCMDIEEIARRHKGRITFWGEIDRQHILPYGTVDDVRKAVRRAAAALYDGRGGVMAQCEFGVGARPDNVRAVYEEWDRVSQAR